LHLAEEEVHKPRWEAVTSDLLPLLASCTWHRKHARRILCDRRVRSGPWWAAGQRHVVTSVPVGLVGIIATWNYPIQLLGIQLVQALMAGNDVVVKPSERSPRTHALLLRLAEQAGLPHGTLRHYPATREAGRELLASEPLNHLIFMGSTAVGRDIATIAATRLLPTTLELSGRDSAIVLSDADVALAARSIWNAVTMNGGQTCMAPRRVLVERGAYDRFISAIAPLAAAARPRRLIDTAAASRCFEFASIAVRMGGRSVSGVLEVTSNDSLIPLAIADCATDCDLALGTHFGPVVAIMPAADADDAVHLHHELSEGHVLATSIFTRSARRARSLVRSVGSGITTINDCVLPTGDPRVSIRGTGPSGWGASRGEDGLVALTRRIHTEQTSAWLRLPLSQPTTAAAARITRLLLGRTSNSPSTALRAQ